MERTTQETIDRAAAAAAKAAHVIIHGHAGTPNQRVGTQKVIEEAIETVLQIEAERQRAHREKLIEYLEIDVRSNAVTWRFGEMVGWYDLTEKPQPQAQAAAEMLVELGLWECNTRCPQRRFYRPVEGSEER